MAGLRPATPADLPAIEALLGASGLPIDGVAGALTGFVVAEQDGAVVGVGGLEVVGSHALLRSVAVVTGHRGTGLGLRLTASLLAEAARAGLESVWLLTETAPAFFSRFGFRVVDRSSAPPELAGTAEFIHCCPASAVAMARRARPLSILVLCTANSARSQLAEALLQHGGGDLVRAASAGTAPGPGPHPAAVAELARRGIGWDGRRSKSVEAVGDGWDLVITVCDGARESCPVLPGHATVHWGLPDPALTSPGEQSAAFRAAADALQERIEALLALPWGAMTAPQVASAAARIHEAASGAPAVG